MADQNRNTLRVQVSILPSDLAELDALAARMCDPGFSPNRSAALRVALRGYFEHAAQRDQPKKSKRSPRRVLTQS